MTKKIVHNVNVHFIMTKNISCKQTSYVCAYSEAI